MHSFDYLFLFEMSEKLSQVRKQMSELRGVGVGEGLCPRVRDRMTTALPKQGKT